MEQVREIGLANSNVVDLLIFNSIGERDNLFCLSSSSLKTSSLHLIVTSCLLLKGGFLFLS
jgi:hypothetical protein